jgi:hypothetical protein
MPSSKRIIFAAGFFAVVFASLSIALFLSLCWTAAADGQGAIAFFFYAPVLFLLIAVSFFLGRYSGRTIPLGRVAKRASIAFAFFYLFFYISPFVGLGSFSNKVISLVAESFKMATGKSPMEWDKNLYE